MSEDEETILAAAKKFWPRVTELVAYHAPFRGPMWLVKTDSGNTVAISFIDPDDLLPWFKPTYSTEEDVDVRRREMERD